MPCRPSFGHGWTGTHLSLIHIYSREDLNIPPFGGQIDHLTYGGIYRAVSLDIKEPAYLRDVFIEATAEGDFRIYTSTVGETVGCTLQAEIRSPSSSRAAYSGELSLPITGVLNGVHPWSIEHPTLYTLCLLYTSPSARRSMFNCSEVPDLPPIR